MAFIMLGAVGFAQLTSPTAYELEKKVDFAEHQVTEGKPLLQYMGPGLDGISLSFLFHADFINPQTAWDQLVDLMNTHAAFPVSMGNGQLLGQFVLTSLTRAASSMANDGTLQAIECRVSLKEWSDPAPLQTRQAEKKQQAKAVKKPGKKKPRTKKATIPQLDAASRAAGYKLTDKKTVVRQ
jgi:hypothetical protein